VAHDYWGLLPYSLRSPEHSGMGERRLEILWGDFGKPSGYARFILVGNGQGRLRMAHGAPKLGTWPWRMSVTDPRRLLTPTIAPAVPEDALALAPKPEAKYSGIAKVQSGMERVPAAY
jgi:hypothetical protein